MSRATHLLSSFHFSLSQVPHRYKFGTFIAFSSLSKLSSLYNKFLKEMVINSSGFLRASHDSHHRQSSPKRRRLFFLQLSTPVLGRSKSKPLSSLKKLKLTNVLDAEQEIWQLWIRIACFHKPTINWNWAAVAPVREGIPQVFYSTTQTTSFKLLARFNRPSSLRK